MRARAYNVYRLFNFGGGRNEKRAREFEMGLCEVFAGIRIIFQFYRVPRERDGVRSFFRIVDY